MNNYTNMNYNQNQIQSVSMEPLNVAPLSPVIGQTYFDTVLKSLRTWDGERWISSADLPIAGIGEEGLLGGIRVGDRLTIDETTGLLSADIQSDNNLTNELRDKILNIDKDIANHNTDVNAHKNIQTKITTEITDRQKADSVLKNKIDLEEQRALSVEAALQTSKEDKANKTIKIDANSTNIQYPTAAAVYQELLKVPKLNNFITPSMEYRVVTYDAQGLVTSGRKIINDDISSGIDATKIGNGSISNTEFQYLNGLNQNIQNTLESLKSSKANKINGTTDLVDVRDDLQGKIDSLNNSVGNNTFGKTIVNKIKDLANTPTVMQANKNKFIVSHINILNGGSGYKAKETFEVGVGSRISCVITGVNSSGAITSLVWSNTTEFSSDIEGTNLSPQSYTGSGTGAKFQVITRYAKGDKVTDGTLEFVPSDDPLVQFSRMEAYISTEFANQRNKEIVGYISNTDPSTKNEIKVGQLWYKSADKSTPNKNFPWSVQEWDGTKWTNTYNYTPSFNDIWSNENVTDPLVSSGYYWFNDWKPYGFTFDPTSFVHTINNETINGVKSFTSTIIGNIDTADKLKTQRNIELTKDVTGNVNFDGSSNVQIETTISSNTITNSMIQNNTIDISKMAQQKITAINSYTSLPANYAVNNVKTAQSWLNDFASRLNYLVNNKNTIFVQSSQPVANRTGDIWVTTVS